MRSRSHLARRGAAAVIVVAASFVWAGPPPTNLPVLECQLHQLAFVYGSAKLPPSADVDALYDALNIDLLCGGNATSLLPPSLPEHAAQHAAVSSAAWRATSPALALAQSAAATTPSGTFYVATTGSDSNAGTMQAPFATPGRAAAAARAIPLPQREAAPALIILKGGTYYLGTAPLALTAADSFVVWQAYPGESPVLAGGAAFTNLTWSPVGGNGVMAASLILPTLPRLHGDGAVAALDATASKYERRWRQWNADGRVGAAPPMLPHTVYVDGVAYIRARYPNGNPRDITGICFSKTQRPGEGCNGYSSCTLGDNGASFPAPPGTGTGDTTPNRGDSPVYGCPQCAAHWGTFSYNIYPFPASHPVYNAPLPGIGWGNLSLFSFWGSPFSRSAQSNLSVSCDSHWRNATSWSAPQYAVYHTFHQSLWGGWAFAIANVTTKANSANPTLVFGYGGYQEARGGSLHSGGNFHVDNVREELDVPGEYYYDPDTATLYVLPNGTSLSAATVVTVPLTDTLLNITGTPGGPYATGIVFDGISFTLSAATYLEAFEVPSGGDWSIHRGAAVFIQDAELVTVANATMRELGGNAVMLSNHVNGSAIVSSEFVYIGESAVALVGSTVLADGSAATYPYDNTIAGNFMHETGLLGKQTSCFFQALGAASNVVDNVCCNGPRAGFNFNDGFYGGNTVRGNLLFNAVRETGDHGPLNSWDRQPYWTLNGLMPGDGMGGGPPDCGGACNLIKAFDVATSNLVINGYNGVWTYDHDDGSQFWEDSESLLIWGGLKNYIGNTKRGIGNVIVHPGIDPRATGDRRCQTDDSGEYSDSLFAGNTCFTADGDFYSWGNCDPANVSWHVYATANNTLYGGADASPTALFDVSCGSTTYPTLPAWQAAGQDAGSTLAPMASVAEIVAMGARVLGLADL